MEKNDGTEERLLDPDSKEDHRRRDKKGSARKKRSSRHGSSEDDDYDSYERRKRKKKKRSRRKDEERSVDSRESESEDEEPRRRKKKKSKSRKRSRRDESSSSSSSSDSESEDGRRRRKKRKDRKRKKHKSKKKKHSRRDSSDEDDASDAGRAPTFGKYGIIKAADFLRMQRSFQVWLAEVKGIPSMPGSKQEQQKYFSDFCEDFNTATMPQQKYYDYEKFEMEEYKKQKAKEEKLSMTGNTLLADEALHKREQQERARARQESERKALYGSMSREKVEEMKHQAKLRSQMQIAYKTGDKQTYQRLKERLEADT